MSDVWGTVYQLERDKATGNDPDSLRREIDRLRCMVAALTEAAVVADSYGVEGSGFHTCLVCGAGGAPGIPFNHTNECAVGRAEETADRWARERREEMEDYEKEEKRLRAALQRLLDWNEGIAAGRGNHYPREHADIARAALTTE